MFTTLFASVGLPVLVDFFKSAAPAVTRKLFGESVEDTLKIQSADIERVKALAELDNPYGTPSQWVVDLRGAFGYVAAGLLVIGGTSVAVMGVVAKDPAIIALGLEMGTAPFGFIFGERLVLSFKGNGR